MDKIRMTFIGLLALLAVSVSSYAATRSTPVTVVNTDSEPVPVTVVGTPTPVNVCTVLRSGGGSSQFIYSVPANMTLAIEYSTIDPVDSMEDTDIVEVAIKTTVGGVEGTFFAGRVAGSEFRLGNDGRVLKVYADPVTDVVGGVGSRDYYGEVEICLSGRLRPAE